MRDRGYSRRLRSFAPPVCVKVIERFQSKAQSAGRLINLSVWHLRIQGVKGFMQRDLAPLAISLLETHHQFAMGGVAESSWTPLDDALVVEFLT